MTTIFTILKDMTDNSFIQMLQYNALASWTRMQPQPRILVFGDKGLSAELCKDLGVEHVTGIATDDSGLELVSDAFHKAWSVSDDKNFCYINADIIMQPTLPYVIESIDCSNFLCVGQRHNTQVDWIIDYTERSWWQKIKAHALTTGHRHTVNGMDYFIHQRASFGYLPDLTVGRWYWDNYMMSKAKQLNMMTIDTTESILAIHQQHDYSHFSGGLEALGNGEQSVANKHDMTQLMTIADCTTKMIEAF